MAEPNTSAAGLTLSLSLGVTGTVLGAQDDGLIVALAGAFLVSFWLTEIDTFLKAAAAVIFCTMLGGYCSPVGAQIVAHIYPEIPNEIPLRLGLALLIGSCGPVLFPIFVQGARRYAAKKIDSSEGGGPT